MLESCSLTSRAQERFYDSGHVDTHVPFHKALKTARPSGASQLRLSQHEPGRCNFTIAVAAFEFTTSPRVATQVLDREGFRYEWCNEQYIRHDRLSRRYYFDTIFHFSSPEKDLPFIFLTHGIEVKVHRYVTNWTLGVCNTIHRTDIPLIIYLLIIKRISIR